jgi:hypothetical protein
MTLKMPNSRRNLDMAIQRVFGDSETYIRIRTVMANTIVAQMLPEGAVKGGTAIKLRLGNNGTRFTSDFDVAYRNDLEGFILAYETNLADGWNGFTGHVVTRSPAKPKDVPAGYVMQPFEIKLAYLGRSWLTVALEVGHNEIGDADKPDWEISPDIVEIFEKLGFPRPRPVAVMAQHHQVAQKIHGASEPGSSRAHDLIDLQLSLSNVELDFEETRATCEKLFAYRQKHAWPPLITKGDDWDELYSYQAAGLNVIQNVDEAVAWANGLIQRIATSDASSR